MTATITADTVPVVVLPCLTILKLANTYGEHVIAYCRALPDHDCEHDWVVL